MVAAKGYELLPTNSIITLGGLTRQMSGKAGMSADHIDLAVSASHI